MQRVIELPQEVGSTGEPSGTLSEEESVPT